jgi:hypothetical protein
MIVDMDEAKWQRVINMLGKGAYVEVADLINNIAQQVNRQMQQAPRTNSEKHHDVPAQPVAG